MAVPVISSPATSDNNISTIESAIFTCDVANSPTYVSVRINGVDFTMTLSAGTTYTTGTVFGCKIGTVAAGTILFTAYNGDGIDTDSSLSQTVTASANKTAVLIAEVLADLTTDGITATVEFEDEKTLSGINGSIRTDLIITCTDTNNVSDIDAVRTSVINNCTGWTGVSATTDVDEWQVPVHNDTKIEFYLRVFHT